MAADRPVELALAEWRDAQRRLDETPSDAHGRTGLAIEVDRLRKEYRRLVDAAAEVVDDRDAP